MLKVPHFSFAMFEKVFLIPAIRLIGGWFYRASQSPLPPASSCRSSDRAVAENRLCCVSSQVSDFPDSGELLVDGQSISGPSAERGLVFQDPNLFPWLTVRRNIEAGLAARGVLQQKRSEVKEFMRLVGLEAFADAYPHHLSGGMAQRGSSGSRLD